jgi:hypothetical protein
MFDLPSDSPLKFLTFLGLIIIYGGVTYAWSQIERIEGQQIDISILDIQFERKREFIDEITDAREAPVLIQIFRKDEVLFKQFIGNEFFDDEIQNDNTDIKKRMRAVLESSPDEVASLLKLRAPSKEDQDSLDGELLSIELKKKRLELKSALLLSSQRFYWLYLIASIVLGLSFIILGFRGWLISEASNSDIPANKPIKRD